MISRPRSLTAARRPLSMCRDPAGDLRPDEVGRAEDVAVGAGEAQAGEIIRVEAEGRAVRAHVLERDRLG